MDIVFHRYLYVHFRETEGSWWGGWLESAKAKVLTAVHAQLTPNFVVTLTFITVRNLAVTEVFQHVKIFRKRVLSSV